MLDAAGVAILGAAGGGSFALLNTLVGKVWDAFAARTTRSRQASGLLAATLVEVLHNADTLANLMMELKTHLQTPDGEVWERVTRSRLKAWAGEHCLRSSEWSRFVSSEVGAEFSPDACVVLGRCYPKMGDLLVLVVSTVSDPIPISRPRLEYLLDTARNLVKPTIMLAMGLAYWCKRLRGNSIWLILVQVLASLGADGEKIEGINWQAGSMEKIRKHLAKVNRAAQEAGGNLPEDSAMAMSVLGLDENP